MTLSEMVAVVAGNIGRADKNDLIPMWLNWTQRRLAKMHDFRALDTMASLQTTVGQDMLNLPLDVRVLWWVRIDGKLVAELHPMELERLIRDRTQVTSAKPRVYAQTSPMPGSADATKALRLWPVPDSVYGVEIAYSRWPKEMTQPTDEPEIPDADDVLIAGATVEAFLHLQQYEDAATWMARFRGEAETLIDTDRRRAGWAPGSEIARKLPRVHVSADPALDPFVKSWR